MKTQQRGKAAEDLAVEYLEKSGLVCLTRNFSCRYGEIDLIMHDKNTLVFVEVRYRKTNTFGGAIASVTYSKQQKIIHTAQYYLQKMNQYNSICRFDVVAISLKDEKPIIEWIENAFSLS